LAHLFDVDQFAMIFGLVLGPDALHRLDPLAAELVACLEHGAVVLDFVPVPTVADAEQEPPVGHAIQRGHQLGGDNGIALRDQADTGADLQVFRHCRGGAERDKRIVDLEIRPD
jgi:hypothetical protein